MYAAIEIEPATWPSTSRSSGWSFAKPGDVQHRQVVVGGGHGLGEIGMPVQRRDVGSDRTPGPPARLSSNRCAQSKLLSGWAKSTAGRLCTMFPLPMISTPSSRSGASLATQLHVVVHALEGVQRQLHHRDRRVREGVHQHRPGAVVQPQLSTSQPTHRGLTASATCSHISGIPGAGYSTSNSSCGKP